MEKIKIPPPAVFQNYQTGKDLAILIGKVITCLMMISLAISFVSFGARLVPNWNGGYIIGLAIFLSLESIYTRKRVRDLDSRDRLIFRISEWIAFAVLIKILIYLVNNPARIMVDITRWQADFLGSFFTGEYILVILFSVLVWWASLAYSSEIEELYEREHDAQWDDIGKLQNVLHDIRNRISARIFGIGALIVIMSVLSRLDISIILLKAGAESLKNIFQVINVLVYFALALVLLTQTQFALLRTRWLTQRLPISPKLAGNWIRSGLAFFFFLAVLVAFLPTNYTIGLLDVIRTLLGFVTKVFSFLLVLIALPITFCLSLFSFGGNTGQEAAPPIVNNFPATAPNQPLAWWEFIKSLAFWVIFIGIIFLALRYYLMQNTALWKALTSFPLLRWFSDTFNSFRAWLAGANRQISGMIKTGVKRLRSQRISLPVSPLRRVFNFSRLGPREKIIYFYLNLIQLGGEHGVERRSSQTPYSYTQNLSSAVPDISSELSNLTDTFIEARYSQHSIEEPHAASAAGYWERIKTVLREWRKPDARN